MFDPPERAATVDALLAASGAAPATRWAAAAARAQAELALEPGHAFAWFNLGSSLTALGDYFATLRVKNPPAAAINVPVTLHVVETITRQIWLPIIMR